MSDQTYDLLYLDIDGVTVECNVRVFGKHDIERKAKEWVEKYVLTKEDDYQIYFYRSSEKVNNEINRSEKR